MPYRLTGLLVLGVLVGVSVLMASASPDDAEPIPDKHLAARQSERVVMIFVDSLSDRVAENEHIMPALVALARRGASFEVEPCRDRLTYLCLHAALTGKDESSLISWPKNFDPTRRAAGSSLFDQLSRAGKRIAFAGTKDFSPYEASFVESRYFARTGEEPSVIVDAFAQLQEKWSPDVLVIGLGSGDLAAHTSGPGSSEYRRTFHAIDRIIGGIARRLDARTSLIVFGDHGHDEKGSHLPGGPATTYALYSGPPFREGFHGDIALTDHRVLLGTLLGTPTPAIYAGPPMDRIFAADWIRRQYGRLPALRKPRETPNRWGEWQLVFVALAAASSFWLCVAHWWPRRSIAVAATVACLSAISGAYYDRIRYFVHDHGYSPARSLYLLVPFALGFLIAGLLRRNRVLRPARAGAWLPTGAAASLLVMLLLLFPSANYYGSSRAVVYAAIVTVAILVFDSRRELCRSTKQRHSVLLALALTTVALATFCRVSRADGNGDFSVYVLNPPVYLEGAAVPLVLGKLAVFFLLAERRPVRPLDLAGAASLLTASLFVQIGGASLHRYAYVALAVCLAGSYGCAKRNAPSTHFCGGILLLNHFYPGAPSQIAPMEVLLASTGAALFAWKRVRMARDSEIAAVGLTIVASAYLLLWPTLGFRLSGIDFRFMFQWVPSEDYERLWWVIAIFTVLKFALPYLLLLQVVARERVPRGTGAVVITVFAAKVALLSILVLAYAAGHSMRTGAGTDMLAELVLVVFVLVFLSPFAREASTEVLWKKAENGGT